MILLFSVHSNFSTLATEESKMVWNGSKVIKLFEGGTKQLVKFRVMNFTLIKVHFPWTRCRDKRMKKVLVETLTVADFFQKFSFHFRSFLFNTA